MSTSALRWANAARNFDKFIRILALSSWELSFGGVSEPDLDEELKWIENEKLLDSYHPDYLISKPQFFDMRTRLSLRSRVFYTKPNFYELQLK